LSIVYTRYYTFVSRNSYQTHLYCNHQVEIERKRAEDDCQILTVVKNQGYNTVIIMADNSFPLITFLQELMHQRMLLPSQLAKELGISHSTVSRWLQGKELPSTKSCRRLAEYSGVPLQRILSFSGHVPEIVESPADNWPEFREYIRQKYPDMLDDDLITLIERLIEQRRGRTHGGRDS